MIEAYVKTTLESATARELVFYELKEFLISSVSGCKERISNFMNKWENYDAQMKKITIAYNKGNWTPELCSESEVSKQVPWKTLVVGYDKGFDSCSIKNEEDEGRDYQPLNFDELLRMTFWESMYAILGHKVIKFLFDKCILIFTIEPEIYLVITSVKCCIPLKVSQKVTAITTSNQKPLLSKPPKLSKIDNLKQKPKHTLVKEGPSTSNEVEITTTAASVKYQTGVVESPSTSNKVRTCNSVTSNSISVKPFLKRKQDAITSAVPSKRTKSNVAVVDENAIIRWITPKDKVLEAIVSDRQKSKQKHNVSSSLTLADSIDRKEHSTVAILKDSFFQAKGVPLDIIGKTSFPIKPDSRLPNGCDGLRLPKDLINDEQCVLLNIYKMSETEAKKYKIRIKPRKRKNKGKPVTDVVVESEIRDHGIREISDSSNDCPEDFSLYFKPYNPFQILPTDAILYNKSSWSKLPSSHFARKIVSMNEEMGINVLMAEVLCLEEDPHRQIVKSKLWDEFRELRNIAATIVSFHKKVKEIHKMIKSCLKHWMNKRIQRSNLKATKKMDRKNLDLNRKNQREKNIAPQTLRSSSRIIYSDNLMQQIENPTAYPSNCSLEVEKSRGTGSIPQNLRHLSQFFPSDSEGCSKSSHLTVSTSTHLSQAKSQKKSKILLFQALKEAIPHACILSTLSQILHLSGAEKFLGSRRNKRAFMSFIKKSVTMGGLRCSLQLGQLISSLHPEDCFWMNQIKNTVTSQRVFSSVVQWLFSNYVLAFMNVSFYGTEVSNSRNHVVFYLRETWKSVTDKLKDHYIKKKTLRPISSTKDKTVQQSSRLRLLPKSNNSVRPLISFKESMHRTLNYNECRHLLNYLNSTKFPQGIQDANGVRANWSSFYQSHNKRKNIPLYYVRVDIMDAYPSVDLNLLKDILIDSFFDNEVFILKKYLVTSVSSPQTPKVRYSLLNINNRTNWYSSILTRPCIIQDTKMNSILDAKNIKLNLAKALKPNILRLGRHNFEFENGLPQGWIMSQHLCNLYYGHMEKKYLSEFIERSGELFIRKVDDYFFVSSDPHRISKFCEKMNKGVGEYNCKVNLTKWATNVHVSSATLMPMTICDWVPFCGWKFCLTTGHVCRDFSPYKGTDMSSAVTFRLNDKIDSDLFIIKRMGVVTPLRLSSLFFDPIVNCRRRIITNIFEAALMLAFRFYAICRIVYPNSKFATARTRLDTLFIAIQRAAKSLTWYVLRGNIYLYPSSPAHLCHHHNRKEMCQKLFKYPTCKVQIIPSADVPLFTSTPKEDILDSSISHSEAFFLVYHAFIIKLSKHSGVFKDSLLPKLRKARSNQRAKFSDRHYHFLMETVGCKMPECFLAIKK